jgi:hypothetical protein
MTNAYQNWLRYCPEIPRTHLGDLFASRPFLASLRSCRAGAFLFFFSISIAVGAADVLTYHNDNARTGWNANEVILTPSNVNANSFGLRFNLLVDGKVDAQPLYVSNAAVFSGITSLGNHNLLIVATEHDSVYAFDADTGTLYWHASLVGSGETPSDDRGCNQVTPEIGVTATPVIDRGVGAYGTIYVVAMSKSATAYHQRLHALNLGTGQEVPGSPVTIQATYPGNGPDNDGNGHVLFDPAAYKERSALLLVNGIVYTTWASHCDDPPYTSWIIGYDETSLAQVRILNLDPNGAATSSFLPDGSGNAFWNSGAGPAADANGNVYDLTANGPFETTLNNGFPSRGDYGDTFLKLSTSGPLTVSDYFTPVDQAAAAADDTDFGSGGAVVLPDMVDGKGATRHLAIGAGKDQNIYLVDRDNMGKFNSGSNSNIYQELQSALLGGEWATAAFFNDSIYYGPVGGALRRFTFTQARLNAVPAAMTSTLFAYPGVTPSISSSGNSSGIVWAYENLGSGNGSAVLHAYDAADLSELYNSDQVPQRDQFGEANKFITPTICNGKVFVATTNSVGVFGLLTAVPTQPPPPNPAPPTTNPTPPATNPTPARGVSKDFNGDGQADLLWENTITGEHSIWIMRNGVPVSGIMLPTIPIEWHIAAAADFLGTGQTDLVWENTITGEHSIWIMQNGAHLYNIALTTIPIQWHIAAAADFLGTGQADLVWENTTTGEHSIWIMRNGVQASNITLPTIPTQWRIAGAADFLGTGQADLVWENTTTGERSIWIMRNGVSDSNITLPTIPTQWRIAGAADFLGTGQADLVWENTTTGERSIWIMRNGVQASNIMLPTIPVQWQIIER